MRKKLPVLLVLCFIFSVLCSATPVKAEIIGEISTSYILTKDQIPANMTLRQARAAGHVKRLYDQESRDNLNTVIFQNADGTNTMYIFSEPVRYIASDGAVRDKKTVIMSSAGNYRYTSADNDVIAKFSQASSDGVSVNFGTYDIRMIPAMAQNSVTTTGEEIHGLASGISVAQRPAEDKISYTNVYGNGSELRYTAQINGIKEEIILSRYTGQHEFAFVVYTDGLSLVKNPVSGEVALFKPNASASRKAEQVAFFSNLYVFDATGKNTTGGDISVSTVTENQIYRVTLSVDPEYLENSRTVYPVTIDPSITASAMFIDDAEIRSTSPTTALGKSPTLSLGGSGTAYGLFKLKVFDVASYMLPYIGSVTKFELQLYCKDVTQTTPSTVSVAENRGATWDESTVTYSNYSYLPGTMLSAQPISMFETLYSFDVTQAYFDLSNGSLNKDKGIGLSCNSPVKYTFATTEYSDTSLRPRLAITYVQYDATLFGTTLADTGHDHTSSLDYAKTVFQRIGMQNFRNVKNVTTSISECRNLIQNTTIFISRSHGTFRTSSGDKRTGIVLNDYEATGEDKLIFWNTEIDNLPENSLSGMRIAIFAACYTAYHGENGDGLLKSIVERGAHAAVGFQTKTICSSLINWTNTVVDKLEAGETINAAATIASEMWGTEKNGLKSAKVYGNKSETLK